MVMVPDLHDRQHRRQGRQGVHCHHPGAQDYNNNWHGYPTFWRWCRTSLTAGAGDTNMSMGTILDPMDIFALIYYT